LAARSWRRTRRTAPMVQGPTPRSDRLVRGNTAVPSGKSSGGR
jgi:hypothetical protein